jgi:hypothetical protein
MTKIDSWPLWIQQIVVIPQAAVMLWLFVRSPKTTKGWYFAFGFFAWMIFFYFFFLR